MDFYETGVPCRRAHRPLVWMGGWFALGIFVQEYVNISFTGLLALAVGSLVLALFLFHGRIAVIFLMIACLSLGATRSRSYQTFPLDHIDRISYADRDGPVQVEGIVVSDVERRPFFKGRKTVFSLKVQRIKTEIGWKSKTGVIHVHLFREEDICYGDQLLLEGKLHRPFNFATDTKFSYRDYLYRQGITFILSVKKDAQMETIQRRQGQRWMDYSLRFKRRLSEILTGALPAKQSGIMRAFLLGERYDLPKNVYDLFKLSGVAHIIAISGFNIGIVASVIFLVLKIFPIPRAGQYVLTILLLIFYAFLTGGQPPVVRATIMAVIFLAGFLIEREPEPLNSWAAAALLILIMNPLNLFDVGFQLSFISVLAILLFYPGFLAVFRKLWPGLEREIEQEIKLKREDPIAYVRVKMIRFLWQSTSVSLAAYMGVVPLVVYYFHLITPVVILANLVIVPLASLIIFLGMGLLAVGFVWPVMAFAFANCIGFLLNVMVAGVFFFAQFPGAYFQLDLPLWSVYLYYALLMSGYWVIAARREASFARSKARGGS